MQVKSVGKIKNIKLNEETAELELTITITNLKFQRQILRNLSLEGNLLIEGDKLIFLPKDDQIA